VDPTVHPGLELVLPAPTAGSRVAFSALEDAVRAAEDVGFASVWVRPAPGAPDPCALAGALVPSTSSIVLGVTAAVPSGRLPSVLAREVTTLDVVSNGRAALLLGGGRAEDPDAADRAARRREVAALCAAMFDQEVTNFDGRFYEVVDAANRPPPVRPGGPPVLVEVDGAGTPESLESLDAVVGSGPASAAERVRRAVDETAGDPPTLLWRAPATPSGAAARGALSHAGVEGVIWQIDGPLPGPREVSALGAAVGVGR